MMQKTVHSLNDYTYDTIFEKTSETFCPVFIWVFHGFIFVFIVRDYKTVICAMWHEN